MSTDVKLSKARLSKIIQSCVFLGSMMSNLGEEALIDLAVSLEEDILLKLATKITSINLGKFERKIRGQEALTAGKRFTLFLSN